MKKENNYEYLGVVSIIKLIAIHAKEVRAVWDKLKITYVQGQYRINLQDLLDKPEQYSLEELDLAIDKVKKLTPQVIKKVRKDFIKIIETKGV